MDGYSGIQLGQSGYVGKVAYSGNGNSGQGVDVTQLQAGDTFKGEIASVNGEDVQILLSSGQFMAARLERDVQVALGQMLTLQVQSNKDNKIVLKPLSDNNSQLMRVGEAALRAANIAVNAKNLNLVSNLLENGMSIDKNTITAFNRLTLQNPGADISQIIGLNKLGVAVNEANLNQFESYQNMQYKLIDGVNEAADEVLKLYDTIATESDANANIANINNTIGNSNNGIANNTNNTNANDSIGIANNGIVNNDEQAQASATQMTQTPDDRLTTANNFMGQVIDLIAEEDNTAHSTEAVTDLAKNDVSLETPKPTIYTPEQKEAAIMELQQDNTSQIPAKIVKNIHDGKFDIKDVRQLLNDENIGGRLTQEQKSEIFRSEPFKSLVKSSLTDKWTLTPNDIAKDGKVEEFYEKLARETTKLSKMMDDALNQSGQDTGAVQTKAVSNMSDNIDFMNQLNHMMNYIQLPLKLSDSQAHGDLYVYSNKKNMASRDGMLTAFMHLDMDNLGSLDVSIALQTQKNQVTTKFYLDEDVISLIEEHKDELIERLSGKGYQCNALIIEKDDEKTVLDHLEEQGVGQSTMIGYRTFDTRA